MFLRRRSIEALLLRKKYNTLGVVNDPVNKMLFTIGGDPKKICINWGHRLTALPSWLLTS